MIKILKDIVYDYKLGLSDTVNLQIIQKKFHNNILSSLEESNQNKNGNLQSSIFRNSELINSKFVNINCTSNKFDNQTLRYSPLINNNLNNIRFTKINFDKC